MRQALHDRSWEAPAAIAGGTLALIARAPSPLAIAVTAAAGVTAGLVSTGRTTGRTASGSGETTVRWAMVFMLGTLPFVLADQAIMQKGLPGAGLVAVGASVIAAVAEEVFFRRLVYDWLLRWGTMVSIVGAAALFAAVHVPVYGLGVLPLDFAAGLVFGWQRHASGSWTAPAATHALVNILAST